MDTDKNGAAPKVTRTRNLMTRLISLREQILKTQDYVDKYGADMGLPASFGKSTDDALAVIEKKLQAQLSPAGKK